MSASKFPLKPSLILAAACFALLSSAIASSQQTNPNYAAKKQAADDAYTSSDMARAASLYEPLATPDNTDWVLFSRYGFCLYGVMSTSDDPAQRNDLADRTRKALTRAKELGDNTVVTSYILAALANGTPAIVTYSQTPDADHDMKLAELDFVRGDLPGATDLYKKALAADPTLYAAALYVGDCLYKTPGKLDEAPEWFAKAVAVNPAPETAYRYWADALTKLGKLDEAREKYIDAYISEPGNRLSVEAFTSWAKGQHITLAHPALNFPVKTETKPDGTPNVTLAIDPSHSESTQFWIFYVGRRITFQKDFSKEFPNEPAYRHTLKEESEAIRGGLDALDPKAKISDPTVSTLIKLQQDGVLEAYILLARSDAGIAKDYAGYVKDHRDLLHRYVENWVITNGGAQK